MRKLLTILLLIPLLSGATNYTWPSGTGNIFIIGSGPNRSFGADLAHGDTVFIPAKSGGYATFSLYRVRGNASYGSIVVYWQTGAYITRNSGSHLFGNAIDSCVGVKIQNMDMSGNIDVVMRLGKDDYGPYSSYQNGYSSYISWDHCTFNNTPGMGLSYWTGWPDYNGDSTMMMHHWKYSYCSFDSSSDQVLAIPTGFIGTYGYWRDVTIEYCTFDHYNSISGPSSYIDFTNCWNAEVKNCRFSNLGMVVSPAGHGAQIYCDACGGLDIHGNKFGPNNWGNELRVKAGGLNLTGYSRISRFYDNIVVNKRKYPVVENQEIAGGTYSTLSYIHRRAGTAVWNNTVYNISKDNYIAVLCDWYLTDSLEAKNNVMVMIRDSAWATSNVRVYSPSNGAVGFVDTARNRLYQFWSSAGITDSTTFTPSVSGPLYNAGLAVPSYITTDYYGNPRSNGTPDIGAVESPTCTGRRLYFRGGTDTTFNALYPGDTVVLNNQNGYIGNTTFNYVRGTASCPIVIMNDPAQDSAVAFKNNVYARYLFNGCWYIKFSGKQRPGLTYGIYGEHFPGSMKQWGGADYFPLHFAQKCKNIEIEGVWMNKVSTGLVVKEDPYCLDSLNFGNGFTIDSILIHDNKFTRIFNEGMYLGNTLPDNNPEGFIWNDTKRPWVCTNIYTGTVRFKASDSTIRFQGNHAAQLPPGTYFRIGGAAAGHNNDFNQSWVVKSYAGASTYVGDTTILHVRNIDLTNAGNWMSDETISAGSVDSVKFNRPMRLGYCHIWNNVTDSTGRGGIQLSSSNSSLSEIDHNDCRHAGLTRVGGQGNGITWGKYTSVNCHDNTVICTVAESFHIAGGGRTGVPQRVENNYADSAGYCNPFVDAYGGNFAVYDVIGDPGNNWVAAIAFRTRGCDSLPQLDSTMFWIKNNKIGIFTLSRQTTWDGKNYGGILIEDYNQSTQRSGNIICSNTALNGVTPVIDNVTKIVQLQYDAGGGQLPPVWTFADCALINNTRLFWLKTKGKRIRKFL